MSNSSLATLKIPAHTNNYTVGREGRKITKITIHHMAAKWTAQRCGESFQVATRKGSSHYGIGYDGVIAQYVDEANTAWTDSNWDSNTTSVTIETANSQNGGNWPVSDVTLASLIKLVAEIAIRNNLGTLIKGKNLTWHQMYSATACPGPYLISKLDYIVQEANKIITNGSDVITTTTPVTIKYQVNDGRWLGNITQHNANDAINGYAGEFGKPISGVYVDASVGNVYYKVRTKGGKWLPEVKNREDYAGILGKPIDGFMIRSDSTKLYYQVHDKTHGWLGVISDYDANNSNTGYAGWTGYEIDGLMIWADPIVTTTIIERPKVEPTPPAAEPKKQLYRIRKSWDDAKSQVGAYSDLEAAKGQCPEGYAVYDVDGNEVFRRAVVEPTPEPPKVEEPVEIPEVKEEPAAPVTPPETPKVEEPTPKPEEEKTEVKEEVASDSVEPEATPVESTDLTTADKDFLSKIMEAIYEMLCKVMLLFKNKKD